MTQPKWEEEFDKYYSRSAEGGWYACYIGNLGEEVHIKDLVRKIKAEAFQRGKDAAVEHIKKEWFPGIANHEEWEPLMYAARNLPEGEDGH
jgi:hypothetical protein